MDSGYRALSVVSPTFCSFFFFLSFIIFPTLGVFTFQNLFLYFWILCLTYLWFYWVLFLSLFILDFCAVFGAFLKRRHSYTILHSTIVCVSGVCVWFLLVFLRSPGYSWTIFYEIPLSAPSCNCECWVLQGAKNPRNAKLAFWHLYPLDSLYGYCWTW